MTDQTAEIALAVSETSVYLMGISFVLGSLFTVLMLLLLDFMQHRRTESDK
jgi:predicted Kef-type K+ transport protein